MLRIENIELYYDQVYALKKVSLSLEEGETVALIGANGAGKSSILRAITGMSKVASGTITFQGKEITGHKPPEIVRMGVSMVPEGRRVFPYMSVKDNLMMGAFTRSGKEGIQKTLQKILALFPILSERYSQAAGTLSGGEQQMLAMGRALMSKPRIILMDEPSMGLSPIFVEEVFRIIKEISAEGTTVLLVEQNAKKALTIADRAYVLETGRIVLQGDAKDLLNNESVKKAYLGE